jgi:two-component system cell cycle response regulator CtrA
MDCTMRALLVDTATANPRLGTILRSSGASVEEAHSCEEALELARHYSFHIVLLDMAMSGTVVPRMRAAGVETPMLIVSSAASPRAKVMKLGFGVEEFITRPFGNSELIARVRAIARCRRSFSQPVLRAGALTLDRDSQEVAYDGRCIHLASREYAVLELLMMRKGVVVDKDAFLDHLYGSVDGPDMKIIDVFVCKLRKKLVQAGAGKLIGTVWRRGYIIREPEMTTPAFAASGVVALGAP